MRTSTRTTTYIIKSSTKTQFDARLSSSGQVTFPSSLRNELGVTAGDTIRFRKITDPKQLKRLEGVIIIERQPSFEEIEHRIREFREEYYAKHPEVKARVLANSGKTVSEMRAEWTSSPEGQAYYREKYGA